MSVAYATRTQAILSFAPFIYVPFEHDTVGQRPTLRAALLLAKFLPSFKIIVGRATGSRFDPGCGGGVWEEEGVGGHSSDDRKTIAGMHLRQNNIPVSHLSYYLCNEC